MPLREEPVEWTADEDPNPVAVLISKKSGAEWRLNIILRRLVLCSSEVLENCRGYPNADVDEAEAPTTEPLEVPVLVERPSG